jgi:hypothetical protein
MTMPIAAHRRRRRRLNMESNGSRADWVSGTAGVATGLGILAFALFPLAIPIVVLTIVATLPLVAPVLAGAAIAAILAGVWLVVRAAGRRIRRLGGPGRSHRASRRAGATKRWPRLGDQGV